MNCQDRREEQQHELSDVQWKPLISALSELPRRNFTSSAGLWIPRLLYFQRDNIIQLYTQSSDGWTPGSSKTLKNTVLNCQIVLLPWLKNTTREALSVWTAEEVVFYKLSGSLDNELSMVEMLELRISLSRRPCQVCTFTGARLFCSFAGDDLGIHELIIRQNGPSMFVRLIESSGTPKSIRNLAALRNAGIAGRATQEVVAQVTERIAKFKRALTQTAESQAGRIIKSMTAADAKNCAVFATIDDQDCMRLYAPASLTQGSLSNAGPAKNFTNDGLKILSRHPCLDLARAYDPTVTPQQFGKVIACDISALGGLSFDFRMSLYTENARRLDLLVKLADPAQCLVQKISLLTLPASVPIRYESGFGGGIIPVDASSSNIVNLQSTPITGAQTPEPHHSAQRAQRPSLTQSQDRSARGSLLSNSQDLWRIDSHPRFQSANVWTVSPYTAVQFSKKAGKDEAGEAIVFCLEHTRVQNDTSAKLIRDGVLAVIDLDKFSYWDPKLISDRSFVTSALVTPSLTTEGDCLRLILRNFLSRGSDASSNIDINTSPPRSSGNDASTLASYLEVKLLILTNEQIWEVSVIPSAAPKLTNHERWFVEALLDVNGAETLTKYQRYFLASVSEPSADHSRSEEITEKLMAIRSIVAKVISVYFDDISELPLLISHDAGLTFNPDICIRLSRSRWILRRISEMFSVPAHMPIHTLMARSGDANFEEARGECLKGQDMLITLAQLSDLICSFQHFTFSAHTPAGLTWDKTAPSTSELVGVVIREAISLPYLLTNLIIESLPKLCSNSIRDNRLLTDLLKKCPKFVTPELIQNQIARRVEAVELLSQDESIMGEDSEQTLPLAHVDELAQLIVTVASQPAWQHRCAQMIRTLYQEQDWERIVDVQLSILNHLERASEDVRGAGVILEIISDHIIKIISETGNFSQIFGPLIRKYERDYDHKIRTWTILGWTWLLSPLLENLGFNALKAFILRTQSSEEEFYNYIQADPEFLQICRIPSGSKFMTEIIGSVADQDRVMSVQLGRLILLNPGEEYLKDLQKTYQLVTRLLLEEEYDNADIIELIKIHQQLQGDGADGSRISLENEANGKRISFDRKGLDGPSLNGASLNGPRLPRQQSSHSGQGSYWRGRLCRLRTLYEDLIKPLELRLKTKYGQQANLSEELFTYDLDGFGDHIFDAYKNHHDATRTLIIQKTGLILEHSVLHKILSLEQFYDLKMLLTAHQVHVNYRSDMDVDLYLRGCFEEALLGMIGNLFVKYKGDGRDLVAMLGGQMSAGSDDYGSGIFARDDVKELITKIRAQFDDRSLGPVVNRLSRKLISKHCTSGLDSDVELELSNIIGISENDDILGHALRNSTRVSEESDKSLTQQHEEFLKFFLQ